MAQVGIQTIHDQTGRMTREGNCGRQRTSCSQAMRTASQEPSAAVLPAVPPVLGSQKV